MIAPSTLGNLPGQLSRLVVVFKARAEFVHFLAS